MAKLNKSPCIGICKLKNDICIGCKRTIKQIEEYGMLTFKEYITEKKKHQYPAIETIWRDSHIDKSIPESLYDIKHRISSFKDNIENNRINSLQDRLSKHYDKDMHVKRLTQMSRPVNKNLWNHHNHDEELENKDEHSRYDKGLTKQKTPQAFHVYSGIRRHPNSYNEGKEIPKKGIVLHHPAYLHTSLDHGIAQDFARTTHNDENQKETHVLKIHVPKGHHGAYTGHYSAHPHEKEFILPRGHNLRIHPNPEIRHQLVGNDHIIAHHIWHTTIEHSK